MQKQKEAQGPNSCQGIFVTSFSFCRLFAIFVRTMSKFRELAWTWGSTFGMMTIFGDFRPFSEGKIGFVS
jgi:hypothetical protein